MMVDIGISKSPNMHIKLIVIFPWLC